MKTTEEVVAITDPGEAGREHHNLGDRFIVRVSNVVAWLFPALMIAICAQVLLRGMGMNQAWLDDFQWWLYGMAVLVGVGYAVTTNSHVRVDIFYEAYDQPKKTRTEIFAITWLFLPFIILCWDVTAIFAVSSVIADEGSDSPNGLHNLWLLKLAMNLSFVFIGIACWAAYVRFLRQLTTVTWFKLAAYALPTTTFLVNLVLYKVIWSFIWLTSEAGTTTRDIGRSAIFDEYEIGPYEIKYTIFLTVAVTAVLLLVLRLMSREPGR